MEKDFHYQIGLSGNNYVEKEGAVYSHSEQMENGLIRVIECDLENKCMKVRTQSENGEWNELELNNLKERDTIDLNDKGMRWEGTSLNGSPFGYGSIYNEDNNLIYEGFMFERMKVCYGKEFYGDSGLNIVEYEGNYYQNKRFGYGELFDKKKKVVYEGEWINNNPIEKRSIVFDEVIKEEEFHFGIKEITIGNKCQYNGDTLIIKGLGHLKRIIIGDDCMDSVTRFELKSIISNCEYSESIFLI